MDWMTTPSAISDPFHVYGNNDRGIDEEDLRSTLTLSPLINIPWGFQVTGSLSLTTGPPWNITYGKDFDGDTVTQDRPAGLAKWSGGRTNSEESSDYQRSENTGSRSAPTDATVGICKARRQPLQLRAPPTSSVAPSRMSYCCHNGTATQRDGAKKLDIRVTKAFTFAERYHLELFMEGYDIFNTPNFQAPSGVISSPAFLTKLTASNPRQVQWGARFTFHAH